MSAVFAAFGIDWRLLLINLINFGILLWVLWYFLYTPLTTMLERRRETVSKGVADAKEAAQKLQEVEQSRSHVLAQAGQEADELIKAARSSGQTRQKEIIAAADASAASILKEAELQAKELKAQTIAESKQEVAKLIVLGMERAMQK